MNDSGAAGSVFDSNTAHLGFVLKVNEIAADVSSNPAGARALTVDVVLNDQTRKLKSVPLLLPFGQTRLPRQGMQVLIVYPWGKTQYPVAIGRMVTPLQQGRPYVYGWSDPLPDPHQNIDDEVLFHPETGAFMRFRTVGSSPTEAAPDGSPAEFDLAFVSGLTINVTESVSMPADPGQDPNPPDMATLTVTLPQSAGTIVIDTPEVGKATIAVSIITNGGTFTLDLTDEGKLNITVPDTVTLTAPKIQLGADGLAEPNGVVTKEDLENNNSELQSAIGIWASANVQKGSGAIAPTNIAPIVVDASITVLAQE